FNKGAGRPARVGGADGRKCTETARPHASETGLRAPCVTPADTAAFDPFAAPFDTTPDAWFRTPADVPSVSPAGTCRACGPGAAGDAVPRDPFVTVSAWQSRGAPVHTDSVGGPAGRFFMA